MRATSPKLPPAHAGLHSQHAGKTNRLQVSFTPGLAAVHIEHLDQTVESDANLLSRLTRQEGAITRSRWVSWWLWWLWWLGRGNPLTAVTLTRQDGDGHQFSIADQDAYTGEQAHWLDTRQGRHGPP